jgi:hypothetical protein
LKKKKKEAGQMQPQVPLSSQPLPPILGRFAPKQAIVFETIDADNLREEGKTPNADRSIPPLNQRK